MSRGVAAVAVCGTVVVVGFAAHLGFGSRDTTTTPIHYSRATVGSGTPVASANLTLPIQVGSASLALPTQEAPIAADMPPMQAFGDETPVLRPAPVQIAAGDAASAEVAAENPIPQPELPTYQLAAAGSIPAADVAPAERAPVSPTPPIDAAPQHVGSVTPGMPVQVASAIPEEAHAVAARPLEARALGALMRVASVNPNDPLPDAKPRARYEDIVNECLVAQICIDEYLWALYQRAPKLDTAKILEKVKVQVKRKGKLRTVTKTVPKYVPQDFTWKDPIAAERAKMSLMDYVIGGMDRRYRTKLYHALRMMDAAGLEPGITSAFRDDYRQAIATGNKASSDSSFHGGSRRGGYGHGMAIDIVSVKGDTRMQRFASSEILWKWIDEHEKELGVGRPYLDRDPPHIAPINGTEWAAKRGRAEARRALLQKKQRTSALAKSKRQPAAVRTDAGKKPAAVEQGKTRANNDAKAKRAATDVGAKRAATDAGNAKRAGTHVGNAKRVNHESNAKRADGDAKAKTASSKGRSI